jgi:hypothetical protein
MKRLTEIDEKTGKVKALVNIEYCIDKLARYEDTNFQPWQIERLVGYLKDERDRINAFFDKEQQTKGE